MGKVTCRRGGCANTRSRAVPGGIQGRPRCRWSWGRGRARLAIAGQSVPDDGAADALPGGVEAAVVGVRTNLGTRRVTYEVIPRHVDPVEGRTSRAPPEPGMDPFQCGEMSHM